MRVMSEVAAVRCLLLVMAFHTVRHGGGRFLPDDGPLRYWTMTNRALDVSFLIMHLVREIYEPRKFVDPHPGNRFPIAGEGREGLDRGLSFLIVSWQPIQNDAPGSPARSPGVAIVWQPRQLNPAVACTLWLKRL